ncbi:metalloregulator ArsR/SmtB family transcription factor [Kitasatospora putterlickiae]|uniref:Metalloregulator ArsR/SmtB family transcription factor n=1 Tax=Kitasatospora putterlickiae TaxID=221725 RepID=A0ABP4J2B8_9ACTN
MDPLAVHKALANPARAEFLLWLKHPERYFDEEYYLERGVGFHIGVCVTEIRERSGLAQSVVSGYLQILRDAGLLVSERVGKWTFYRRDEETIAAFAAYVRDEL